MTILATVVICTHNPRQDFLTRTLDALRQQTLLHDKWELVIVDNSSSPPIDERLSSLGQTIDWHPNGRIVVESELGLSHARKRGYLESKGELLVLVDDDNLLAADYLERAVEIASSKPFLGTFGGQCLPEYETQPAPNVRPFLGGLAIRELNCDSWSNLLSWNNSHPFGAGMCVRRGVLERLYQGKDALGRMLQLDRKGLDLASHGDHFINCYACKLGFGCGTFTALKLTHLMPSIRVTQKYLLRLYIGHAHSKIKLHSFFGMIPSDPLATFKDKIKFLFRWMTIRESTRRQFYWHETIASSKAIRAAKQEAEVHDEKQSSK